MLRSSKVLPLTLAVATLVLATLTVLVGCNSSNSTQARFVNAISDAGSLDIDFNGTKEFSSVGTNTVSASAYIGVPSGSDMIEGFAAGGTTVAFASQTVSLNSGSAYTLVATGLLTGTVNVLPFVDTNTAPANGSVNFRVINASSFGPTGDGGAVDVYILPTGTNFSSCTAPNCISALGFKSSSSYATLPFNSNGNGWQLIVTVSPGSTTPYFNVPLGNVGSASEGAVCTLVLTDQANGSNMSSTPVKLNDLNCSGL